MGVKLTLNPEERRLVKNKVLKIDLPNGLKQILIKMLDRIKLSFELNNIIMAVFYRFRKKFAETWVKKVNYTIPGTERLEE